MRLNAMTQTGQTSDEVRVRLRLLTVQGGSLLFFNYMPGQRSTDLTDNTKYNCITAPTRHPKAASAISVWHWGQRTGFAPHVCREGLPSGVLSLTVGPHGDARR
jgi:hypothetical protein